MNNTVKLQKWKAAQKQHRLSDKQVQMARELGLNADKLGKMDNHKQEPWKTPLPQHIENLYYKHFGKDSPDEIKSIDRLLKEEQLKKDKAAKVKAEKRRVRAGFADRLNAVIEEMKNIFASVPYGIDHTLHVLDNARIIIKEEQFDQLRYGVIIELSAVLHDIGAVEAQKKYGSMEGKYQEQEGPSVARRIMEKHGYDAVMIDRVCYIVGNHHSPDKIDDMDFQVLWEADLIENIQVMDCLKEKDALNQFVTGNFKTDAGITLALNRYQLMSN